MVVYFVYGKRHSTLNNAVVKANANEDDNVSRISVDSKTANAKDNISYVASDILNTNAA